VVSLVVGLGLVLVLVLSIGLKARIIPAQAEGLGTVAPRL
jgi:hypothetical protein